MRRIVVFLLIFTLTVTLMPAGAMASTEKKPMPAGKHMVKYAKQYVGSRYKRSGKHLKNLNNKRDKNRIDCTGFVQAIYKRYAKTSLPGGNLKRMMRKGKRIGTYIGKGSKAYRKAKPGDILIFKPGRWRQHVAIYYGKVNGKHMMIDSSRKCKGVSVHKVWKSPRAIIRLEDTIEKKSKIYKKYVKEIEEENEEREKEQLPDDETLTDVEIINQEEDEDGEKTVESPENGETADSEKAAEGHITEGEAQTPPETPPDDQTANTGS